MVRMDNRYNKIWRTSVVELIYCCTPVKEVIKKEYYVFHLSFQLVIVCITDLQFVLDITELQVVLAMARNLSIGNESKIDPKGGKKCLKVPKKTCQIGLILVLLSAHIERVSVSRMRDFFDGFPKISAESLSCRQLQINSRALFSSRISQNFLWPFRII